MDNINFTGLKNIAACISVQPLNRGREITRSNIFLELTDDKFGNDLTEFKKVYEQCMPESGIKKYKKPELINIMTFVSNKNGDIPALAVNFGKIPVIDKTMPLFTFVAKLTRKLMKMPDAALISDKNANILHADDFLIPEINLQQIAKNATEYAQNYAAFCHPENIKTTAEQINKQIQKQTMNYFE